MIHPTNREEGMLAGKCVFCVLCLLLYFFSFLWLQKSDMSSVENLGNPEKDEVENKISYSITGSKHCLIMITALLYPSLHSAPPSPLHPLPLPAVHLCPPTPKPPSVLQGNTCCWPWPQIPPSLFFKAVKKKIVNNRVCKMNVYSLNNDVMKPLSHPLPNWLLLLLH